MPHGQAFASGSGSSRSPVGWFASSRSCRSHSRFTDGSRLPAYLNWIATPGEIQMEPCPSPTPGSSRQLNGNASCALQLRVDDELQVRERPVVDGDRRRPAVDEGAHG